MNTIITKIKVTFSQDTKESYLVCPNFKKKKIKEFNLRTLFQGPQRWLIFFFYHWWQNQGFFVVKGTLKEVSLSRWMLADWPRCLFLVNTSCILKKAHSQVYKCHQPSQTQVLGELISKDTNFFKWYRVRKSHSKQNYMILHWLSDL